MSVDLLQYAPGDRRALFLDDQLDTIRAEREEARRAWIEGQSAEHAWEFLELANEWMAKREEMSPQQRAENRCLLVIDVNLKDFDDIRSLEDHADFSDNLPQHPESIDTHDGRYAGWVLLEHVVRGDPRLRDLPVIMLSGYVIGQAKPRLKRAEDDHSAPTRFIQKAAVGDPNKNGTGFRNVACDLLYDTRLLFLHRLAGFWELEQNQVTGMLGLRDPDKISAVGELYDRGRQQATTDADQRVQILYAIRKNLKNLFRNRVSEMDWLTSRHSQLVNRSPLDLMTSGEFAELAALRSYVDKICGR